MTCETPAEINMSAAVARKLSPELMDLSHYSSFVKVCRIHSELQRKKDKNGNEDWSIGGSRNYGGAIDVDQVSSKRSISSRHLQFNCWPTCWNEKLLADFHEKLNPQKKFAPGDYFEVINSVNYFAQLGELNDVCGQHQSTLYNLNELNKC